tara:strand:- start:72 stop:599 length:528 start_codon:yes stop_codon:yes gene_type:complete
VKFPNRKDYETTNDFFDELEKWCLHLLHRMDIEVLKSHNPSVVFTQAKEDEYIKSWKRTSTEPHAMLMRQIDLHRETPSDELLFNMFDSFTEAQVLEVKVSDQEKLSERTGIDYKKIKYIANLLSWTSRTDKEIAEQIIKMDLYKDENIDNLIRNISRWRKSDNFPKFRPAAYKK